MKMRKCGYLKNVKEVLTLTCYDSCEQKRHTFQETYTAPVIGLNHVKLKKITCVAIITLIKSLDF